MRTGALGPRWITVFWEPPGLWPGAVYPRSIRSTLRAGPGRIGRGARGGRLSPGIDGSVLLPSAPLFLKEPRGLQRPGQGPAASLPGLRSLFLEKDVPIGIDPHGPSVQRKALSVEGDRRTVVERDVDPHHPLPLSNKGAAQGERVRERAISTAFSPSE